MNPTSPAAPLPLAELLARVEDGRIDTVVVAFIDLQGRLMGKRVTGRFFVDHILDLSAADPAAAGEGIEACDYLLTVDVDMNVIEGYRYSSWEGGYGDFRCVPDLSTLRLTPWLEGTALVLGDVVDHAGAPVEVSPRRILQRQVERAAAMGLVINVGAELEFFAFNRPYDDLARGGYANLLDDASSWYNLDYHILQTTKDEPLLRAMRNQLLEAGLPVEFSKGEAAPGQHELNLRFSEAVRMADNHTIYKNAAKEIAWTQGRSVTFMAKPFIDEPGSSCHIHCSLWSTEGEPLSYSAAGEHHLSPLMRAFMGGLVAHASDLSLCFAPFINSYKRYQPGSWAPTAAVWSPDNRTCGFRLVGHSPASLRIENRIPGADANPYVAFAAMIAAGIDGIESGRDCGDPYTGNGYTAPDLDRVPWNLPEAIARFRHSELAVAAFGDDVHFHLLHTAEQEWRAFNNQVTPWELRRNFERI